MVRMTKVVHNGRCDRTIHCIFVVVCPGSSSSVVGWYCDDRIMDRCLLHRDCFPERSHKLLFINHPNHTQQFLIQLIFFACIKSDKVHPTSITPGIVKARAAANVHQDTDTLEYYLCYYSWYGCYYRYHCRGLSYPQLYLWSMIAVSHHWHLE